MKRREETCLLDPPLFDKVLLTSIVLLFLLFLLAITTHAAEPFKDVAKESISKN